MRIRLIDMKVEFIMKKKTRFFLEFLLHFPNDYVPYEVHKIQLMSLCP